MDTCWIQRNVTLRRGLAPLRSQGFLALTAWDVLKDHGEEALRQFDAIIVSNEDLEHHEHQ